MSKFAILIKDVSDRFRGHAVLYKVDPPMSWVEYTKEGEKRHETNYVIVSAAIASGSGPDTFIFPANEEGRIVNWMEMEGSFRGELDHVRVLANAGYEIVAGTFKR